MNMEVVRADTLAFGAKIEQNTQPLDEAYFTVKKDADGIAAAQVKLGEGIELAETGDDFLVYRVRVAPELTAALNPGNYYYDFQIGINGDVFTVLMGTLTVYDELTKG